eukprot:1158989-Pelagomonas_calceolata.AAC.2
MGQARGWGSCAVGGLGSRCGCALGSSGCCGICGGCGVCDSCGVCGGQGCMGGCFRRAWSKAVWRQWSRIRGHGCGCGCCSSTPHQLCQRGCQGHQVLKQDTYATHDCCPSCANMADEGTRSWSACAYKFARHEPQWG